MNDLWDSTYQRLRAMYHELLSLRDRPSYLTDAEIAAGTDRVLDMHRVWVREILRNIGDVERYVRDFVDPLSDVECDREMLVLARFIRENLPSVHGQLQGAEGIARWKALRGKKHGS